MGTTRRFCLVENMPSSSCVTVNYQCLAAACSTRWRQVSLNFGRVDQGLPKYTCFVELACLIMIHQHCQMRFPRSAKRHIASVLEFSPCTVTHIHIGNWKALRCFPRWPTQLAKGCETDGLCCIMPAQVRACDIHS